MKATSSKASRSAPRCRRLTVRFTRERLVRYAGASTDFNPIHYSEYFAAGWACPV